MILKPSAIKIIFILIIIYIAGFYYFILNKFNDINKQDTNLINYTNNLNIR